VQRASRPRCMHRAVFIVIHRTPRPGSWGWQAGPRSGQVAAVTARSRATRFRIPFLGRAAPNAKCMLLRRRRAAEGSLIADSLPARFIANVTFHQLRTFRRMMLCARSAKERTRSRGSTVYSFNFDQQASVQFALPLHRRGLRRLNMHEHKITSVMTRFS
jgi:hypothetical protein